MTKAHAGYSVADVPLGKIKPYARNARNIPESAVAKVAASIRAFGFRQPIVCDPKMVVIVGHTRLLAAQSLGLKTAPVHVAKGLTPAQVRAYRLADNRTAQEATWDNDALVEELLALKADAFDLPLTGFDAAELDALMGNVADGAFPALSSDEKPPFEQMTFTLHVSQADVVREALDAAKAAGPFVNAPNENSNGNALARLAEVALAGLR